MAVEAAESDGELIPGLEVTEEAEATVEDTEEAAAS